VIYYHAFGSVLWQRRHYYLIIMPFLESTFETFERITPYSEDRAIEMAIDVSMGLAVCHERSIIHRDVKPGNIFVSDASRFQAQPVYAEYIQSKRWPLYILGDFSNAKDTTDSTGSTSTVPMATFGFEPPEILDVQIPTAPYDIYSLGAVLYWTCNRNRVGKDDYALSERENDGSRFRKRPVDASDELWQIIKHATQFDPSKRYQSARQMTDELMRLRESRDKNTAKSAAVKTKSAPVRSTAVESRTRLIPTSIVMAALFGLQIWCRQTGDPYSLILPSRLALLAVSIIFYWDVFSAGFTVGSAALAVAAAAATLFDFLELQLSSLLDIGITAVRAAFFAAVGVIWFADLLKKRKE